MTLTTILPNEATTVTRSLKLVEPVEDALLVRLAAIEGVIAVIPSPSRKRLEITYDVRSTVMGALEHVAVTLGLKLSRSIFARLGCAWAAFQDDNLRSQAKLVHNCCSVPPAGK